MKAIFDKIWSNFPKLEKNSFEDKVPRLNLSGGSQVEYLLVTRQKPGRILTSNQAAAR